MWSGVLGVSLCALVAAGRPTTVVITSERSGAASYATAIAKTVDQELRSAAAGTPIAEAVVQERLAALKPKSCSGNPACVSKLAAALGAEAVLVSVDVGKLGARLTIHLEAVSASGESLESVNLSAAANAWQLDLSGPISLFAQALAQKLKPAAASAAAVVAPPPVSAPPPPPPEARPKSTPWAAWALLVVGLGAAGTTAGFGIDGVSAKSAYDNSFLTSGMPYVGPDGHPASHLTQPQLDSLRNHGNTSFTVALAASVAGAALLALALWLFVSD